MKLALAALVLAATPAVAETFEVKMLNRGAAGPMIYQPDFLRIAPGDTVKFLATSTGHNAASIEGMAPEGAAPFKGQINEEIAFAPTVPGLYGVKCSPHYAMGMVMLIAVGDADPATVAIPEAVPDRARTRFEAIVEAAD
ncbi:MAG TPA: pseudoazurin [Amaricoccus sp.]|uniref:pseudoazurin n=1 Tax=Amaricoccus sp. TaxID=1872485 RepID=UPI002D03022E|nr:pseudoazurin [Amaricoccus sp.]HMQ94457.1 pseudoazurin [Amaricoccus sp.]HMR54399.1 pseudoazurin [Amaricoccus sp.]HMR61848.1 pseudoazurin [Amaricoccus sp.]HMU01421.1 pseudoazurin [Amaricoccus sp.]